MTTAMIIDDDAVTRAALEDCLTEAGYTVFEAGDGEQGLDAFERVKPDIVLLDVTMPRMDGFEVCRRIRTLEDGQHIPIVMMTGHDDVDSIDRSYESGATDFSTKPLNPQLLIHRLRYLIRAKETSDRLRISEESLATAQHLAKMGNWEYCLRTRQFWCSRQARELFRLPDDGPVTLDDVLAELSEEDSKRAVSAFLAAYRDDGEPYDIDFRLVRRDGRILYIHQETGFHRDRTGRLDKAMGTFQDVTEIREAEKRIREMAFFDNVTQLPNRTFFMERLTSLLELAKRERTSLALMFVDLDQFKRVNDSWGHHAGDELLRQASKRLKDSLRKCDAVTRIDGDARDNLARLGGDEFVVLMPNVRRPEDAARIARRILEEFNKPFTIEDTEIFVSASIGISSYPNDGADEQTLLKHADVAMYQVKENGRNGYRFYAPEMNTRSIERLNLETSLWHALKNGDFDLHYQPKISLPAESVIGVEALLRWRHADLGMVSPADFIPVAEESGLIVPLGKWVLEEACRQVAEWQSSSGLSLEVSVNISAVQFQGLELADTIRQAVCGAGIAASSLQIELTESTLMRDTERHIEMLIELREMGVGVAIDDFGTGYSSLSYLKRLPIDCLKIDRCFVREMTMDARDAAIIRSTIALARNLGLESIAEGVENLDQKTLLSSFGCSAVQGYLYAPPMSANDFISWYCTNQGSTDRRAASVI